MDHTQIQALIKENGSLFWSIPEKDKENISLDSLVETILNYGNERSVKQLLGIIGIQQVAEIFYRQISKKRSNYFPQVKNYFNLYFQKHAH